MIRFEHPWALALALLALPLVVLGWRVLRRGDRARRTTILVLRTAVLLGIVTMLAGPQSVREHHHLTVIGLLDVSGSVKRFASLPDRPDLGISSNIGYLRHWFREATGTREPDDRFGLVVFDGDAVAISAPTSGPYVDDNLDVSVIEGTNVEAAIRLGLAMFPPDSARRLVLVTDGNETTGSAIDAARVAGGGASLTTVRVPVDVVPIEYRLGGDVRVARIEAPPNGQPGQSITLRIVVESTIETQGTLSLLAEERPVDLNGDAPGRDRRIRVPVGESVHFATIALGDTPLNRFEARFTPDDPAADALSDNNHAESFTSTPGRGRVLIVSHVEPNDHPLAAALVASRLPVEVVPPSGLTTSLLALQAYDLVVLDDVGAYEIMPEQQEMLAVYVNDFGGGLLMVGGENGFGAGGWNGTPVEAVLPLELDPPRELRLPGAALVLVLDRSGSMNRSVAGARASQQTVANEGAALAVESLRAESYIGVIAFDSTPHVQVELQLNDDPAAIAERIRAIQSDGGTAIRPALERARSMLRDCDAPKKRVVLLTDGRSPNAGMDTLVEAMPAFGDRPSAWTRSSRP